MKKSILSIAILFALLVSTFSFAIPVSAASVTEDLFYLDSQCNIIVDVKYDTSSEPDITIISPNGSSFAIEKMEKNATEKYIRYYIPDARSGNWRITFDSSYKGHLEVNVVRYTRDIEIKYFNIDSISGDYAHVSFNVGFSKNINYNYIISAVTLTESGNVEGKKELTSGWASTGREESLGMMLYSLQTYDDYYLMLEVSYEDYDTEITHSMLSDKFEYTNGNLYSPITDYTVLLNVSSGRLTVDWSNNYVSASKYNIAVEADGETVYADILSSDVTSVDTITVDPTVSEIKVSLSYERYGSLSQIHTVSVKPAQMGVTIPTEATTSSTQAEVEYTVNSKTDAYVLINDEPEEKIMLDGTGSFTVPLKEGYNDLSIVQIYSDNVAFVIEKRIFVDQFAPVIRFFENLSNITTEEKTFTVVGEVESGCTFTVNGEVQAPAADGTFTIPLTLTYGVNTFEFVVTDAAGNVSKRTVSITCTANTAVGELMAKFSLEILILIGLGAVALIALIISILLMIKKKKFTANNILTLVFVLLLVATAAIGTITVSKMLAKSDLAAIVNGEEFYEIAKDSIDKANEYLVKYDEATAIANKYLLITAIVAAVAVLVLVAKILVKTISKKIAAKKATQKAKTEQQAKEKTLNEKAPQDNVSEKKIEEIPASEEKVIEEASNETDSDETNSEENDSSESNE